MERKKRVLMPVSPKADEVREGEEVVEESEDSASERGNENVVVRRQKEVIAPTSEEMRAHRATHIPFRNWCPECVAGRGKEPDSGRGRFCHSCQRRRVGPLEQSGF